VSHFVSHLAKCSYPPGFLTQAGLPRGSMPPALVMRPIFMIFPIPYYGATFSQLLAFRSYSQVSVAKFPPLTSVPPNRNTRSRSFT